MGDGGGGSDEGGDVVQLPERPEYAHTLRGRMEFHMGLLLSRRNENAL